MQPETYTLMHRMYCVASDKREIEMVLRRFKEIYEGTKGSDNRNDKFDAAWSLSCMAGLYARLCEPFLAERCYIDAISLFETNEMSLNAATVCVALAKFLWEQGKIDNAEAMLRMNIVYLVRHWGTGNKHVLNAEEELLHLQNTGQMIEAHLHHWCKACNIDDFGVGFDFEDSDRAER